MNFSAYPQYRSSGIDWLGEIPEHWNVIPVKGVYQRVKRTNFSEVELLSVYRDYGVIPKSSRDDNNNKESDDLTPYQLVKMDDLVMNKMKAWQGSIAVSEYEGIVSPAYYVYSPGPRHKELLYPRYIHYLLRSAIYITQYLARSKGIRVNQWDLDAGAFERIEILLPSKQEQEHIFKFLDRETARIDKLIAEKQNFIKLLKEKRQALISHVVTKGLDPNVKMKDSGIEWIGEVPEHWAISKLERFIEVRDGTHDTPDYVDISDSSFPLITSVNFFGNIIDFENAKHISEKDHFEIVKRSKVERGDVLMSMIGGNIGKSLIVDTDIQFSIKNVALFKTGMAQSVAKLLLYYLQSNLLDVQITLLNRGGAQGFLSLGDIRGLKFIWSSTMELEEIVQFLEDKTTRIDQLINEVTDSICLLREHKTALISAAVTGKIDVRHNNRCPPNRSC